MKKLRTYNILVILCLISIPSLAQNTVENNKSAELVKNLGMANIISYPTTNLFQIGNTVKSTNSIFLEQIGSNNRTHIRTNTESSNIELLQNGNRNEVRMDITAISAAQRMNQRGNDHRILEFSNSPNMNIQHSIDQNGFGQNLTIHGNNSLSEKMRLTMEGNTKTVIIRNFN